METSTQNTLKYDPNTSHDTVSKSRLMRALTSVSLINYAIFYFIQSLLQIQSWFNRFRWRWRPTSALELDLAEKKVLSYLKTPYKSYYVNIGSGWGLDSNKIWTIEMSPQTGLHESRNGNENEALPLVLIHGFASAVGLWSLNFDSLMKTNRKLYAFDILGFGKSSRPFFDKSEKVEHELIESIERWRTKVGLNDKFILLGHSFGGYLATSYALRYPERVSHLILADPWGMPPQQEDLVNQRLKQLNFRRRLLVEFARTMFQTFSPLATLRAAGPWGPKLLYKLRSDLGKKFETVSGKDGAQFFLEYIYHCNAQSNPSGEIAFKSMSSSIGWARYPMINRITELHTNIDLTFICGSDSWIGREPAFQTKSLLGDRVDVHVIEDSGHHVYADKPEEFNDLVSKTCYAVDEKLESNRNNR